jgi:shikimate dehydrogenase
VRSTIPFIDNALALPAGEFAVIIGARPSRGARSPRLWNAVYQALGRDCRMLPCDVSAEQLPSLLAWLDEQPAFVGGAVAVPHKQTVAHWLGTERLDPSAQGILAVNALSRDAQGQLRGANTDGLAAAQVLKEAGLSATDRVLVFGFGGAAKALVNALRGHVARVTVATRAFDDAGAVELARWMGVELIAPTASGEALEQATVLVNGTVLGAAPDHLGASPLPADFEHRVRRLKLAFDVVYQPADTAFLNRMPAGIVRRGGARMNLLQAVRGFQLAHPDVAEAFIAPIMTQAALP